MEKSMLSIPEYYEKNGNVYLVLRNKISGHSKTIHDSVMEKIESDWRFYNETQKRIFQYLFFNQKGTLEDFSKYTSVNTKTVRTYCNEFINLNLVERVSEKQRDINALYILKKH